MLREIFRFELRQQLKAPLFWIIALGFGALAFALASTDAVVVGGASGNVMRNAPIVLARILNALTLISMFLVATFVASAALRDFDLRTAELVFSTPVSRGAYLGGRFIAGYVATVLVMLACVIGIVLGNLMPCVDPARLGPFSIAGYAWGFGVVVLPDLLLISALLFMLASVTRTLLATYIGIIAFFVLYAVAGRLTQDVDNHTLAALLDPFGARTIGIVTRYWSADQLNHQLPSVSGLLLFNRLLWSGVAIVLLAVGFTLFRTDREGVQAPRRRARKHRGEPPMLRAELRTPTVTLADDARAHRVQLWTMFRFDTVSVLTGVPFLVMLALGLANLIASLALSGLIYGTPTYPVTHQVLELIRGTFHWLLYIIVAFYAGELVWRDRSLRTAEVSDTYPLRNWIPLTAKFLALAVVIVIFLAVGSTVGVLWQLSHGYNHLELGLYAGQLALAALPFLLLAVLALFLQVIANNKFLGYLLIILWFAFSIGASFLHWDHNLYNYAGTPDLPYSDMAGYGPYLKAVLWFDGYWACFAAALLCLAALFWARGTDQGWKLRRKEARARLSKPLGWSLAIALAAFVASGAWIFYNTNVLNTYHNSETENRQHAEYEQHYAKYRNLPQPRITAIKADVDIYPYAPRHLDLRVHYVLTNKHDQPISDLHVNTDTQFTSTRLDFAPHDVVSEDKALGYTIYRLKTPLAPGASMNFDVTMSYAPRGFTNKPEGQFLVDNGTFFNSGVLPRFGYQPTEQLIDRNDRRKYHLSATVPRMPPLGDEKARANTYIANDADWIAFDTTVSTAADQTALAPGYLQKTWTENGRRYFHYVMDKPMLPFAAWLSARYAVRKEDVNGVSVEVYYNPAHSWNVDDMLRGVKDALTYYDTNYTPYQFRQVRILEFPNYASYAQSFANTIPFSESIGFIADLRDPSKIDYPYYVTAHEVAHQWWAHQVIGANMQGSTMLSESLAQYSALMVMEHRYGANQMRKFLKYELDQYLAGRASETVAEEPLARVENQQYIHYRKGSLIFYALKDYIGEDNFNRMLKSFLEAKQYQQPPYTDSQEFMDALSSAAGPQWHSLLDDFFWKITLFDNRISAATATRRADGSYEVTMKVHAAKYYVDGKGKETEARPDIPVDIGVFAAPTAAGQEGKPLYLEKRTLPEGDSTITVVVQGKPAEAGIDPYNKLIDRVSGDNRKAVSLSSP